MITILIGIILIVYLIKNAHKLDEVLIALGCVVSIVIIICGILVPMAGYTEPMVETIELMPLRLEQATDKVYYIKEKDNYYYYAYDNSEEYGLAGGAYEESSVYKGSTVKLYESEECVTPLLKVFKTKSKVSWYTFAGMWEEEEYVFYIPLATKHVVEEE